MLQKQGGDLVRTQEADCFLGPHSPCCVLELDAFGGGWCVLAKAKSLFCIWGETLLELMGSEDQREDNISVSAFLSLLKDHTAENMDSKIVRGLLFWQLRMQEFFFLNTLHLRASILIYSSGFLSVWNVQRSLRKVLWETLTVWSQSYLVPFPPWQRFERSQNRCFLKSFAVATSFIPYPGFHLHPFPYMHFRN